MFIERVINGEPIGRYLTHGSSSLWEWGYLEEAVLFSPDFSVDVASDWRSVDAETLLPVL